MLDIPSLLAALRAHQYMIVAVLVVGWLTRMTSDMSKFPVTIPRRWQPLVPVVLGQVFAVLQAKVGGKPWSAAILDGLAVAFFTMGLFDLVVKAAFNGNEPKWLALLALIFPPAPPAPAPVEVVADPPDTKPSGSKKTLLPPNP